MYVNKHDFPYIGTLIRGDSYMTRNIQNLPPTPKTPAGYASWREKVMAHRLTVLKATNQRSANWREARKVEIERCRQDRLYLANVYGTIYESRPDESDENRANSGYLPLIMYPFQIHVWDWLDQRMATTGKYGDGVMPKARTMGISNITVFWAGTKWMIDKPFQARLASRVAELVDATGDPDSLFWKLDTFLQGLPDWLFTALVPGFDWRRHRTNMRLRNPTNGNLIKGESTTANLGRGGRASVIIYDESAFMENFGTIWTAGRASTRHRIAVSTVNTDAGMEFYNLHMGKGGYTRPAVLEVPWNAHPDHGTEWLVQEFERDTIEGVKREVLMDYYAGTGEWVYPESHKKSVGDYAYEPYAGPVFGVFDDGFDDEWAMHLIQYNKLTGRHRVLESYRNKHKKVDHYGSLMTGVSRSDVEWGDDEMAFVNLIRILPNVIWIGDPHINNREQITGMSVFDHLAKEWNIHVMFDMVKREHKDRWVALSHLLPLFDFNDTPRVSYALEALQRNRYRKNKHGAELQSEAKQPIHDDSSHPTTAFEWYAVNFESFRHVFSGQSMSWEGEMNV